MSSTLGLQNMDFDCIDQSTKDIIIGFIKRSQLLLKSDTANNIIPKLVIRLCLLFYYQNEYLTTDDKNVKIDAKTLSFAQCLNDVDAVGHKIVGNFIIDKSKSNYIYIWEIKIHKLPHFPSTNLEIGITENWEDSKASYLQSYFYDGGGHATHNVFWKEYGRSFGENDIITMRLDVGKRTLEFLKNGTSQGIAFDDIAFTCDDSLWFQMRNVEEKGISYRLFIKLPGKDTQIELLKFHQLHVSDSS